MSKTLTRIIPAFIAAMFCFFPVLTGELAASVIEKGDDIQFSPLHHIDDDVYTFSKNPISMDGFIDGDFTSMASDVTINGEITGNGNLFAIQSFHNGIIKGSLRSFSNSFTINGRVDRSVMAVCAKFNLSGQGEIGRDIHVIGVDIDIYGTVGGDLKIKGKEVRLMGNIEGDVFIEADRLIISAPAVIHGDLTYESATEAQIDSFGVTISGVTEWIKENEAADIEADELRNTVVIFSEILAAFLFGLILLIPGRNYAKVAYTQLKEKFAVSLATGFITVFLFGLAAFLALLTSFLFLVGFALASGDTPVAGAMVLIFSTIIFPVSAFGAVSGGILLYVGKILMAFFIGISLVKKIKKNPVLLSKTQLLLGLIVLAIIFAIPYLGIVLYLVGSMTGAGAIILAIRKIKFEVKIDNSDSTSDDSKHLS